jgi:FkbM family methyltransferase
MAKDSNYVLSVGKKFEDRLMRLNAFSNPYSFAFLQRAGLKKGDHVIDVGCGIGELTCWLAEQVGPEGKVVAIDISTEQLELAKQRANEKGLSNIEFYELSIYDLLKLNTKFDVVYSRYVIDHVTEQQRALATMAEITRENGVICSEVCAFYTRTAFAYPIVPARDTLHLWFDNLRRLNIYSIDLGLRLPSMLRQLSLKKISIDLVQPTLKSYYEREHEVLLIDECRQSFIDQGIATQEEIEKIRASISAAIANEKIQFFWFQVAQVTAIK